MRRTKKPAPSRTWPTMSRVEQRLLRDERMGAIRCDVMALPERQRLRC